MPDQALEGQIDGLMEIVDSFFRLKPNLKAVLPEDLARLKERLDQMHPEGPHHREAGYELFYEVCASLFEVAQPPTMTQLSHALDVPLSSATRMVDWLVKSGYAHRLSDADDRRIVRVALTDTGRALYETINGFIRERIRRVLLCFSPDEREQVVVLLKKLAVAVEDTAGCAKG